MKVTSQGQFTFTGLPAGQYRLAALYDAEPGMWFDPAFLQQLVEAEASVAVELVAGQQATQTLQVRR